jgi:hypothetical protein
VRSLEGGYRGRRRVFRPAHHWNPRRESRAHTLVNCIVDVLRCQWTCDASPVFSCAHASHRDPGPWQLWSYMHFCMRLRQMNSLEAAGPLSLRLGMRRVELEVWREISDSAKPTFNWLAFERAAQQGSEEVPAAGPLPGRVSSVGRDAPHPSQKVWTALGMLWCQCRVTMMSHLWQPGRDVPK